MRLRARYIHVLAVLALVLSSISPACAFISGKASENIEICTSEGIKTVSVEVPGEAPEPERHAKKDDCGFCFVQAHGKSDIFVLTFAFTASVEQPFADRSVRPDRFELAALSPRAPPLSA
jgi:hypothetical protein